MDINKTIADYLSGGKRLVIPTLGAFIRKDKTGEVVFVEFLRKDDGVLRGELMSRYGLSESEAAYHIDNYIAGLRREAPVSGFAIAELGVIRVDGNGLYWLDCGAGEPEARRDAAVREENPDRVEESGQVPSERPARTNYNAIPDFPSKVSPPASITLEKRETDIADDGTRQKKAKRADLIMIVALIAAGIAICAMIYGITNNQQAAPKQPLTEQSAVPM